MPKVVLCAVNLSSLADEAIGQAGQMAAQADAELIVFHTVEAAPVVAGTLPEVLPAQWQLLEESKASVRGALEATVARVLGPGMPVRVEVEVSVGPIHVAILEKARAVEAALVVVASRPAKGLDRILLGAAAEKVVRHAHCPVLCARPSPVRGRILAAADLSPASQVALRAAAWEAQRRELPLTVVHCLDLGPEPTGHWGPAAAMRTADEPARLALRRRALEQIAGWLLEAEVRAEVLIEDGPPVVEILRLAESLPASLVICGTTGRTGLKRILLGSVAEGLARKAPCSVLAVRMPRAAGANE